ncbi:hypothetical protein Lqui_2701 [Legionella quinlivanii]|uniref:Lipocalin-like domain-containing protein n=1 Tax=Legionella quinlivanii TaxID=45073 RepID=A0A0W0XL48_9GAMM|nr:hypothetical protein [Legionella quinlivanii]KTD45230.1 hypothetical protein Lqui_2701 [Legionella quinlivanii]MCW8450353.1 hypothetical protein [Legionella quinlivanii]SEG04447.1 hypothetical protein SAMN02746093_01725 [Legionella quinlivanii DSM 21216]STY11470.1 Uncharacterised protein [Legionella quinlivanii]
MLQRTIASILLVTVVASTANSSNTLTSIIFANKNLLKSKTQNAISINSETKATNFSGNWIGTCSDIDGPVPMEIDQSDDSISLDGQEFLFGAMTTLASSSKTTYDNTQLRLTWNPTKTKLTANGTTTYSSYDEKNVLTLISEATLSLNDNTLVMKIKSVLYNNLESTGETYKGSCSFTKAS